MHDSWPHVELLTDNDMEDADEPTLATARSPSFLMALMHDPKTLPLTVFEASSGVDGNMSSFPLLVGWLAGWLSGLFGVFTLSLFLRSHW